MPLFPKDDFDKRQTVVQLLGSWFGRDTTQPDQAQSIVEGLISLFRQTDVTRDNLIECMSRFTVPALSRVGYELIRIRRESGTQDATIPRYGEGAEYGDGTRYGIPLADRWVFDVAGIPDQIGLIADHTDQPTVVLFPGMDFDILDNRLSFRENPFDNPLLNAREIYENGVVIDYELTLWAIDARRDQGDIWNFYGFATGFNHRSSNRYRDFVNALWDTWTQGPSIEQVRRLALSIADAPISETDEIVEALTTDARGQLIITDKSVYRAHADAALLVDVGQVLTKGEELVDTVRVNRIAGFDAVENLSGLALDAGWLENGFYGELTFDNRTVPLVTEMLDGRLRVSFELGGWPGDVDRFWDRMHEKGLEADQTLAQLLDQREEPIGEPLAESLPSEINPLEFLADNVLRNRVVVVQLKAATFGPDALPLTFLNALRAVIPPQYGVMVVLELAFTGDEITMDSPGTLDQPGGEDGPLVGYDLGIVEDTLSPEALISESPRLRHLDGGCL